MTQFFNELKNQNISYCLISGYEDLPYTLKGDLDIWISKEDQLRFISIMYQLAERLNWKIIRTNRSPRLISGLEGKYYLVRYIEPYTVMQVDLWTILHWKGIPYIHIDRIIRNIQFNNHGYPVLPEADRYFILIIKDLLYNLTVKNERWENIDRILFKNQIRFNEAYQTIGKKLFNHVIFFIDAQNHVAENQLGLRLRLYLIFRAFLYGGMKQFKYWIKYLKKTIQIIKNDHRLFVVFTGPDGVGKSTAIRNVLTADYLTEIFEKIYYFHTQFNCLPPMKYLKNIFSRKKIDTVSQRQLESVSFLKAIMRPIYYGINNLLGYACIKLNLINKGYLVVFDRYYYEYLIQREFSKCPRWLIKFFLSIIPKPDIVFFLKGTPAVILSRKKELSVEEICFQIDRYTHEMANLNNSYIVNADRSIQFVVSYIHKIILNTLESNRFKNTTYYTMV